jgi:CubicO group peptidase (beta-lactamase class C family)
LPLLSLLVALSLAAPPADSIAARADRYLAARTALGAFSGAVVIARAGVPVYAGGHGYADFARRTPFTPDTRIPIASLSKMFTAMAVLRLEADGKLRLSDTLEGPDPWKAITLEQLIQHSSGIPDYEESLGMATPGVLRGNVASRRGRAPGRVGEETTAFVRPGIADALLEHRLPRARAGRAEGVRHAVRSVRHRNAAEARGHDPFRRVRRQDETR